jgi:hypothetical protein
MAAFIEFTLDSGGTVRVESPTAARGVGPAGAIDRVARKAGETLRESLGSVVEAADDIMTAFAALPRTPEELEIKFGVSLDAGFNAVIASSKGAAHLEVTIHWKPVPSR